MSSQLIVAPAKTIKICEENRFSRFVKGTRESLEFKALIRWQQWFIKRGIGAVITKNYSGYALYREGLIDIPLHDEAICPYPPCSKPFKFYPDHPQSHCSRKCQLANKLWSGE